MITREIKIAIENLKKAIDNDYEDLTEPDKRIIMTKLKQYIDML